MEIQLLPRILHDFFLGIHGKNLHNFYLYIIFMNVEKIFPVLGNQTQSGRYVH